MTPTDRAFERRMTPRLKLTVQLDGHPPLELAMNMSDEEGKSLLLSERAVDDATFWARYCADLKGLMALRQFRRKREERLNNFFNELLVTLIKSIEDKEEWNKYGLD